MPFQWPLLEPKMFMVQWSLENFPNASYHNAQYFPIKEINFAEFCKQTTATQ